jgi:hypothetical protein
MPLGKDPRRESRQPAFTLRDSATPRFKPRIPGVLLPKNMFFAKRTQFQSMFTGDFEKFKAILKPIKPISNQKKSHFKANF